MKTLCSFLIAVLAIAVSSCNFACADQTLQAGVASVDITPSEPVLLAGSPAPQKSAAVRTRLYVKALVLSDSQTKIAIVTLDTLKYPVELADEAREKIEHETGIPVSHIIINASHTHSAPLWSYYPDKLGSPIVEAVSMAAKNLQPCRVGFAKGRAEGLSQCRRVIKEGRAWNRWQLKSDEADLYPAESEADPELGVLAIVGADEKYKAIVYNFACHATNTRDIIISADYPGDVQQHVNRQLGYDVPALFLSGASGDINPIYQVAMDQFGKVIGESIVRQLKEDLAPIDHPTLAIESRDIEMPARENPVFQEQEIVRNWPDQLEHYRTAFNEMKKAEKPNYLFHFTGIAIGDQFAIATNPTELFCQAGMNIKRQSPFALTMVASQTNGAHGYVPTATAFAGGSYETWFGEHSYLSVNAAEVIEENSLGILRSLQSKGVQK